MDYVTAVYYSQQELLKENPTILHNYAQKQGIRSKNIRDLSWLIAINIIAPAFAERVQIAHMKGGNLNYQKRLDVIEAIKNGDIKIHKCDLDRYLKNQKRKKAGASSSELIFGTIKALGSNTNTVVKMAAIPDSIIGDDDHLSIVEDGYYVTNKEFHALVFEALIYKHIIDYMLQNQITPNVPAYYGYLICKNQKYKQELHDIPFGLLFIEEMVGVTLGNYFETRKVDTKGWRSIFFQILYTLHCFHLLHINHNDNHPHNIFVETINDGEAINDDVTYYTAKNTYYTVPINGALIKIFDFDLTGMDCDAALKDPSLPADVKQQIQKFATELRISTKRKTSCDNLKIDRFMTILGINNKNTPLFDVYILFCTLWHGVKNGMPNEVKQFCQDIFGTSLEYKNPPGGFQCRVPHLTINPTFRDADGNPLYKTIPEILEMSFFDEYRNNGVISNNRFHLPTVSPSSIKSE